MSEKLAGFNAFLVDGDKRIKCIAVDHKDAYIAFIMPEDFPEDLKREAGNAPYAQALCKKENIEIGTPVEFTIDNSGDFIYDEDSYNERVQTPKWFKRKTIITIDGVKRTYIGIEPT